jgi:hypothetical protein
VGKINVTQKKVGPTLERCIAHMCTKSYIGFYNVILESFNLKFDLFF